jgi:hypothetical protein
MTSALTSLQDEQLRRAMRTIENAAIVVSHTLAKAADIAPQELGVPMMSGLVICLAMNTDEVRCMRAVLLAVCHSLLSCSIEAKGRDLKPLLGRPTYSVWKC